MLSLSNTESIWNPVASVAFRSNVKLDKLNREATWIVQDEGVIWKPIESSWKSRIEVDSSWMKSQWMEYYKTQWYYIPEWSVGMWRKDMRIMYHNDFFLNLFLCLLFNNYFIFRYIQIDEVGRWRKYMMLAASRKAGFQNLNTAAQNQNKYQIYRNKQQNNNNNK